MTRFTKEVLRCNLCGTRISDPHTPQKWDPSARASIILQKTHGMPWHRQEKIQSLYGTPLSDSTAYGVTKDVWDECGYAIFDHLVCKLADCQNIHIDDTGGKIVDVMIANKDLPKNEQKDCHTTVFYAETKEGWRIVLYMTDQKYAGENLTYVLGRRNELYKDRCVRVMKDASGQSKAVVRNNEINVKKIVDLNCMTHARRKFDEIKDDFPQECGYFLDQIGKIYHNDDICKKYNGRQRLKYHKQHSQPLIKNIYKKIHELMRNKRVEPNSSLGKAMQYWLNHKRGLIKFLYRKDCPLDNNVDERAVRPFALQRKNSYFFKTKIGATVGSGLHSLVETCHVNGINAFKYLIWLQDNWVEAQKSPQDYTPFAYQKHQKKCMNDTERIKGVA